jgi:flagellar basal body-associated protein FliL
MEENIQEQTTQPKKKGKGCLIAILVVIVLLGGGIYLGIRTIRNFSLQKDLGVTYTEADAEEILTELGTNVPLESICMNCDQQTFSNYKEVKVTATNSQATAVTNMINQELPVGSISNTQVKFNEDGSTELSTNFNYNGQAYPVYLKGVFSNDSSTTVTGELQILSAGPVSLPSNLSGIVENFLIDLANQKIEEYGIEMNEISVDAGGLNIDALIPTEVE